MFTHILIIFAYKKILNFRNIIKKLFFEILDNYFRIPDKAHLEQIYNILTK